MLSAPRAPLETPLALRPDDAARAIGLSRAQVYRLMDRGELASFKAGSARLIAIAELRRWVENASAAPVAAGR